MASESGGEDAILLVEIVPVGSGAAGETMRGPWTSRVEALTEAQMAHALGAVRRLAVQTRAMAAQLQAHSAHDDLSRVEVEFGLKFNAELQAYIAKTTGEATVTVKLTWSPKGG